MIDSSTLQSICKFSKTDRGFRNRLNALQKSVKSNTNARGYYNNLEYTQQEYALLIVKYLIERYQFVKAIYNLQEVKEIIHQNLMNSLGIKYD